MMAPRLYVITCGACSRRTATIIRSDDPTVLTWPCPRCGLAATVVGPMSSDAGWEMVLDTGKPKAPDVPISPEAMKRGVRRRK